MNDGERSSEKLDCLHMFARVTLKRKLAKGPFHFLGHEILSRRRENLFMTELSLLRHSILVL